MTRLAFTDNAVVVTELRLSFHILSKLKRQMRQVLALNP